MDYPTRKDICSAGILEPCCLTFEDHVMTSFSRVTCPTKNAGTSVRIRQVGLGIGWQEK
jgi:hypothetical protein